MNQAIIIILSVLTGMEIQSVSMQPIGHPLFFIVGNIVVIGLLLIIDFLGSIL